MLCLSYINLNMCPFAASAVAYPVPPCYCFLFCSSETEMAVVERVPPLRLPKKFRHETHMDPSWKMVCVTSAASPLGLCLSKLLLSKGYTLRLTVTSSVEWDNCRGQLQEFVQNQRVTVAVVDLLADPASFVAEAFQGCHGVFHTSSFVDPHGVTGYRESIVGLEEMVAKKVIEACSVTPSVRKCVFTSSLAACVWFSDSGIDVVDELCWSDQELCKQNKLWMALSKTKAEKSAWNVVDQMGGVQMVSLCTAIISGLGSSQVSYLKGAVEMYSMGVLASVEAEVTATAHMRVYEEMCHGRASGRYLCYDTPILNCQDFKNLHSRFHPQVAVQSQIQHRIPATLLRNRKLQRLLANSFGSIRTCGWPGHT